MNPKTPRCNGAEKNSLIGQHKPCPGINCEIYMLAFFSPFKGPYGVHVEQTHELQLWHFMNIDLAAVAVQEVMESDIIQNMLSEMHLHLLLVYVTNVLLV